MRALEKLFLVQALAVGQLRHAHSEGRLVDLRYRGRPGPPMKVQIAPGVVNHTRFDAFLTCFSARRRWRSR